MKKIKDFIYKIKDYGSCIQNLASGIESNWL